MNLIGFKEWLSKTAPEGGGEIWDDRTNADLDFGRTGAGSRNRHKGNQNKPGQVEIDPEKLFFGISKKCNPKLDRDKNSNIGGNYGNHI